MSKFRRQLMMASILEPVPPEPPTPIERMRQLGCIMWFPLDETNGLNDVIGGKVINETTSGTFVWSSGYGLYYVILRNTSTSVANIEVSWSESDFVDGCFTSIQQARRYPNSNYRGTANVFDNGFYTYNSNITADTRSWSTDNLEQSAVVVGTNSRKIYISNGSLGLSDSTNLTKPWTLTKYNIKAYATWTENKRVFIKNLIMFNRALTAEEVAEVYTIINT